MTEDWINIHTHRPGPGINIVDPCLGEVESPEAGLVYYSLGVHPLYIGEQVEQQIESIGLAAAENRIVAVGEAGLDRNSPMSVDKQMEVFRLQAEIAAWYDLPLIIHGVRAIPEVITVHNRCRKPEKWIMHGFNNRREVLQELLKHGFYISAGRHVMNESSNIYQLLSEIPSERLFVETDDSDFSITEIYHAVAERRNIAVEELQQVVRRNFEKLFRI